jgi:ubiquinone/menaquinone biosynthesis C-methylase UbiE
MGHSDRERRRLALQGTILHPFIEHLFRRAGITTGMHVLDIGCGVGDLSLLAARLTGRTGSVTSLDIDSDALQTLRDRAAQEGLRNIVCVKGDIHSLDLGRQFDAVVGRHILIHAKDPLSVLISCRELLHPRGIAAFQEYDFQLVTPSHPATPLRDSTFKFANACMARIAHANIGSRLFHLFREAGFPHPDCRGEFPVDGGVDSPYHEWITEAVRSMLPHGIALNVPGAADIDIDTLETRLRSEAQIGSGLSGPLMFSCFARRE